MQLKHKSCQNIFWYLTFDSGVALVPIKHHYLNSWWPNMMSLYAMTSPCNEFTFLHDNWQKKLINEPEMDTLAFLQK